MTSESKQHSRSFLSKDEIKQLRSPNDIKAISMFVVNWVMIAGCFLIIANTSSLLVIVLALFVMAGRQLGIGILLHECSHRSFFSTIKWNRFIGHWFGGIPILVPYDFYRPYHLSHHAKTGTDGDPDVENIRQYPVSKMSLVRKVVRDFVGLSGLKMLFGVLFYVLSNRAGNAYSLGVTNSEEGQNRDPKISRKNYAHALLFHSSFFSVFYLSGQPSLYLYWWLCFIFFYPFILRMRQIAEHGAMTQLSSNDVRDTTRTTIARWWERLLFAPNFVNFHCEHHYLPTVPSYNLPAMHDLLKERGFYVGKEGALVDKGGYFEVGRLAMSKA